MTPTTAGAETLWWSLHHAYGPASDMAGLLAALANARGWKLRRLMTELCNRVLHQGTIYSASPPAVVHLLAMVPKTNPRDRALLYEVLAEFAASSRKAIRDGCAIACCAGGDPQHGSAILAEIQAAHDQIAPDLVSSDAGLRRYAGDLLCCSADARSESAHLVRARFEVENDRATRKELLESLSRVRGRFADWPDFLSAAIGRESDPKIRFVLLYEQICERRNATDAPAVSDFISVFAASASEFNADCGPFFEALAWLGSERQLTGLLHALQACRDRRIVLAIAERLLRLVFQDGRSGWENTTFRIVRDMPAGRESGVYKSHAELRNSMIKGIVKLAFFGVLWKIFPFLLRRRLRKSANRRHEIEYWKIVGDPPDLPMPLTADQQRALVGLADKPEAWIDQTNLWSLFGLPDNAADLRGFLAARV